MNYLKTGDREAILKKKPVVVKVGTSYFEYRKHGQFEFAAPCILFACLIFTLTAPLYIWTII